MTIVLIGMPGCGKSTVGVLLAKTLLMDFVDTDLVLQNRYGKSLCEIMQDGGVEAFKRKENQVLSQLSCENCVVATGGSAVYGKDAMEHLGLQGRIVYLKLPTQELVSRIENITTRGIAMKKGGTIEELYTERAPLYERYADVTIDCTGLKAEQCVQRIAALFQ